jgi:pseudouridine synthase
LATGIDIDGEVTLPARVTMLNPLSVQIGITQGRNRQVRKMFLALGYKITSLRRVSIGAVRVGTIPLGKYQVLTARPKL